MPVEQQNCHISYLLQSSLSGCAMWTKLATVSERPVIYFHLAQNDRVFYFWSNHPDQQSLPRPECLLCKTNSCSKTKPATPTQPASTGRFDSHHSAQGIFTTRREVSPASQRCPNATSSRATWRLVAVVAQMPSDVRPEHRKIINVLVGVGLS